MSLRYIKLLGTGSCFSGKWASWVVSGMYTFRVVCEELIYLLVSDIIFIVFEHQPW